MINLDDRARFDGEYARHVNGVYEGTPPSMHSALISERMQLGLLYYLFNKAERRQQEDGYCTYEAECLKMLINYMHKKLGDD